MDVCIVFVITEKGDRVAGVLASDTPKETIEQYGNMWRMKLSGQAWWYEIWAVQDISKGIS